jgi:UDPglucose 6-dehydrogenase
MEALYAPFMRQRDRMMLMDVRSAEFTKYAANCMLATKISFMNEMANLAEQLGADIEEVRKGIGSDPRIGYHFIYPGLGYGGSCFPKDVAALIRTAREKRSPLSLIEQVQTVNSERKIAMAKRVEHAVGGSLAGKTVAVLGVAFKPDTDDVREAPSLILIPMLQEKGAKVRAYDPHARENAEPLLPDIKWCESALEAADSADVIVVMTEWNEFRALDLDALKRRMRGDVLVDLRNIYLPAQARAAGFSYSGIGR